MRFPAFAVLALCVAAIAAAQTSTPWDYEGKRGALAWGRLDPAFRACSQGREQSPIDIRGAHLNKALQPIEFHYIAGAVTLKNNGHTQNLSGPEVSIRGFSSSGDEAAFVINCIKEGL